MTKRMAGAVELSCQLCGRAILEYEVDNGNVGCIGLQPYPYLGHGGNRLHGKASFLKVGLDRYGSEGLILTNQAGIQRRWDE